MTIQGFQRPEHRSDLLLSTSAPAHGVGRTLAWRAARVLQWAASAVLIVAAGCSESTSSDLGGTNADGGSFRVVRPTGGVTSGSSRGTPVVVPPSGEGGVGGAGAGGSVGGKTDAGPGGETIGTTGTGVYLAHEIVVKRAFSASPTAFQAALDALGGKRLDPSSLLAFELGYERIGLPQAITADAAIAALMGKGVTESAERNYLVPAEATTNDPSLASLWGLTKAKAREAWDLSTGDGAVLVAITDTGLDVNHPDIAANVYHNPGEIPGDGIDNDGNGLVDDVSGWNFVNGNNQLADLQGHGTHVAGTIGAVGNNGIGVVGVNWKVSILPIKVCAQVGCYTTDVVNGFLYAGRMGARVVNTSLGGYYSALAYERAAIANLGSHGGLLVAAAGNAGANNDTRPVYPASYDLDNIVSIAATAQDDSLASFSCYGARSVHLAAPGVSILSTTPNGQYGSMSGTSMATPHTVGAAALLLAHKPSLSYHGVRASLLQSAFPVPGLSSKVSSGGRLDVLQLLAMEDPCDPSQCSVNATCATVGTSTQCACKPGYQGDGKTCTDVDECGFYPVPCSANAACTNTAGSYVCACRAGFTGSGIVCNDVNECAQGSYSCGSNSSCVNTPGGYDCACNAGFERISGQCVDIDECATATANCDPNAVCANKVGGFTCACKAGYNGDGLHCSDVDECAAKTSLCDGNANCKNTGGSYECSCKGGFTARGAACIDVDECALGTHECNPNAVCVNSPGSYACECPGGATCPGEDRCLPGLESCDPHATCTNRGGSYRCRCNPGYAGDGFFCFDVDECTPSLNDCGANAFCTDKAGSHTCTCKAGYEGDGHTCVDVDECQNGSARCDAHASCANTTGGYACTCNAGFEGDGTTCTDVDECARHTDDCGANAVCNNTPGTFSCACRPGFTGDGHFCTDIDECAARPCSDLAVCVNTPGSYSCTCKTGYEGNGATCTDVDECAAGTHQCGPGGICTNTVGSYTCQCGPGYQGNGTVCTDIDECASNPQRCGPKSICLNTPGSFGCGCTIGYEWNGSACVDTDECANGTHDCSPDATCRNTNGNYTCTCNPGFEGGGLTCEDVDECGRGWAHCGEGSSCKNTHGSHVCVCKPGFKGNGGGKCDEIDECADGTNQCSPAAICTNTQGSYKCACKPGYTGDGFHCTDSDECSTVPSVCDVHATCANTPGGHTCTCAAGYTGDGVRCNDINECQNGTATCSTNARCLNKAGTYACACNAGYSGDGFNCAEVDECSLGTDKCDAHATCTNTPGAYQCVCQSGYQGDGFTCTPPGDVDECQNGTAQCSAHAICRNTTGGYVCECQPGYEGDGHTCVDVDECARGTTNCDALATCTNTPGSFTCQCPAGYSGDGVSCVPPDACATASTQCDPRAHCRATGNGYACICPAGFSGDGFTCTDIDECATGAAQCDPNAICTNNAGGFTCTCPAGYTGNGSTCSRDECGLGLAQCDVNAICVDTADAYTCQCRPGYAGNGATCADVDECATGADRCSPDATCTNTVGGYTCACNAGYQGTGFTCAAPPKRIQAIDTRGDHTCALLDNGTLRCWGRNDDGQLGYAHTEIIGDDEKADLAGTVDVGDVVKQVAVGVAHTCALLQDGRVRCWGRNHYGQLGYSHTRNVGDDELPRTAGDVDVGGAVVQLAAGGEHTCALLANGAVRCWGLGASGRLGYANQANIGDDETPATAGDVDLGGAALEISAGRDHTCARLADGRVRCWGRGTWSPLGYGHTEDIGDDERPASAGDVNVGGKAVQISAGWYHTCAVLDTHAVRCWGYGRVGQLGYGNAETIGDDEVPASVGDVPVGGSVVQVAAGLYHTCALMAQGGVRCWGYGLDGRLGYGTTDNVGDDETPASMGDVNLGASSLQVAVGYAHSCAVLTSGSVRCWGSGELGRLGSGTTTAIGDDETPSGAPPVILTGGVDECALGIDDCDVNATCTDAPSGFSCACKGGYAGDGRHCADIDECSAGAPCAAEASCTNNAGSFVCACRSGYAGNGFVCADVDECANGAAHCDVNAACANTPGAYQCSCRPGYQGDGVTCTIIAKVVMTAGGGSHTCALVNTGDVRCWGANSYGQLGYGNVTAIGDDEHPYTAGNVDIGGKAQEIAAGENHTCALLEDGQVRCWGRGTAGQLGYGNANDVGDNESPRSAGNVNVGAKVIRIAAGQQHTCAILEGGSVRCWGLGETGRLGYANSRTVGDDETPASMGDISLGGKAVRLALGSYHSCALLDSGAVRCWGFGLYGQLGHGQSATIGDDETPASAGNVNIGGVADRIAAGAYHTCVRLDTGAVRCWGYGIYGALGYGNTETIGNDEAPASAGDVPLGAQALDLAAGGHHTCALLPSGAVRCWGYGLHGVPGYASVSTLGDNETPASVGDLTLGASATHIACGASHTCAVSDDGVRCWGEGALGRLGRVSVADIGDNETPAAGGIVRILGP